MNSIDSISHTGIVTNHIKDLAVIHLLSKEECSSCSMKGFCAPDDDDRSRFEVDRDDLEIGDQVSLEIKPGTGLKAMFWAYLLPFMLIFTVLAVALSLQLAEEWSGLLSLSVLIPYFLALYAFRNRLRAQVSLKVSKL